MTRALLIAIYIALPWLVLAASLSPLPQGLAVGGAPFKLPQSFARLVRRLLLLR